MNAAASLALCQFAEAIKQKFSTHISGEPEDQIRAPFEQLLGDMARALGIAGIIPVGETRLSNGIGRPDYSVARDKLRSEEHTSELQSLAYLVCRLLLEKKNTDPTRPRHTSSPR